MDDNDHKQNVLPEQPDNIPKKISEFQSLRGILTGVILIVASIIIGTVVYQYSLVGSILIGGGGLVISGIVITISAIGFRQLRDAEKSPNSFNEFQTSTAVKYKTPLSAANMSPDEVVEGWLGPVTVGGRGGFSFQLVNKEYTNQSANTLLFTNKQIVAVLIGPQDMPPSLAADTAFTAVQYSPEDAVTKNVQFDALYAHKWGDILRSVMASGLQNLPQQHLTYAIPYDQVKNAEIVKKIINSGITVTLKNGKKLVYNTLLKEQLDSAQPILQKYIQVI